MGLFDPIGTAARGVRHAGRRIGFVSGALAICQQVERGGLSEPDRVFVFDTQHTLGVRVHHQPHGLAGQFIRHLEARAQIRYRAVLAHQALDAVPEQRVELGGLGPQRADARQILLVARQRRLSSQPGMWRMVIDLFDPRPQPRIEVTQVVDVTRIEFAEELTAEGTVPALQFALGFLMNSNS